MRLLLDTHALIYALQDDPRLPSGVRALLLDPVTVAHVSPVSLWEIAIKRSLGKLRADPGTIMAALDDGSFVELPIRASHGLVAGSLPRLHADPFDRMLIAQARLEGLTLVSGDRAIGRYQVPLLWK